MSKIKWVSGAAMLACTGALVSYSLAGQASAGTAPNSAAVHAKNTAVQGASSRTGSSVLSGKRQVSIVRVQASESALSLTGDGRLAEVDDDSGRRLFVPVPLGGGKYQIKAYDTPNGHPAADEPSCWQVYNPGTSEPLSVQAAVCDAGDAGQWFTITKRTKGTYAISNSSAYLQHSPTRGLILEELGDAPLTTTFRFVDNGPAPAATR